MVTFTSVYTRRILIVFHLFFFFFTVEELGNGSSLHLFKDEKQAQSAATNEHIDFTPHYNTLICGGAHEYYGTEDRKPLCKYLHDRMSIVCSISFIASTSQNAHVP